MFLYVCRRRISGVIIYGQKGQKIPHKKIGLNHKSALTFLLFNIFCWNFNWRQISFWNARFRGVFMIGWLLVPPLRPLLIIYETEIYKSWPNFRFHIWRVQKCVQMVQNSPEMNRSRCVDVCTYLVFVLTPNICGNTPIVISQNIDFELTRWSETPYFKDFWPLDVLFF